MACFFSVNRPIGCVRSAATDLTSISCNVESTKPISDYLATLPSSLNLYGCSALELLFLRGNGELPETDEDEKKLICSSIIWKWKMGWALKKPSNDGISDLAHKEAAEYFMAQRSMVPPRRAEPRAFSLMMESMRNTDGSYKFEAHELLTEKQLTGMFSRFETKRVSGVTVARKTRGRQQSKSSRKRAHPVSSEEDVVAVLEETEDDQEGEDYEPEMDEEDFVRDCIRRNHNDIFL